jgi:hypothetical protein
MQARRTRYVLQQRSQVCLRTLVRYTGPTRSPQPLRAHFFFFIPRLEFYYKKTTCFSSLKTRFYQLISVASNYFVFDFRKATSEEDVSGGELKGLQVYVYVNM